MADLEEETSCIGRCYLRSSGYIVPILGLVAVNVTYGALSVMFSSLLASGLDLLFTVYANDLAVFIFLSPFAAWAERHKWPERLGTKLAVHLVLLSLGGVTVFHVLGLLGLQRTSPTMTTAIGNLVPGLTFLIACCLRFEKFDAKCRYSLAKAVGTLLCVAGIIAMSLLQQGVATGSDCTSYPSSLDSVLCTGPTREWISGCAYLFAAMFIASCTILLQAVVLQDLPAPLSLVAITSAMSAFFAAMIQLLYKGTLSPGHHSLSTALVVTSIIVNSVVASTCNGFRMGCIRKQGPVFVSVFSPITTLSSTILSAVLQGKFMSRGSLAGVFVVITGLYIVLWAKAKECPVTLINNRDGKDGHLAVDDRDIKKPLLS